ncbi:uncharacterized protein [Pempheris klunzingeri]|uniref:uncharacterized protein n=1 Tax=Pempheris klunzingeri TaxID=3127111 RepID=UPI00398001CE
MGTNKETLLLMLLPLLHACAASIAECPTLPHGLTCDCDFNRNITCVWNSTYVSDHPDPGCTLYAKRSDKGRYKFNSSCNLEPVDVSRPALKKCSLIFKDEWTFIYSYLVAFNLSCKSMNQNLIMTYKPSCHVKLNPPSEPHINLTTVTWNAQVTKHEKFSMYSSELQWKQVDQSWSDPSVRKVPLEDNETFTVLLDENELIKGERYEARARVKASDPELPGLIWSEWSHTASWESVIGRTKPPPPSSDLVGGVLGIMAAVAAFTVCLAICFKNDKTWVYKLKVITGPPQPHPADLFLQHDWLSPHFTSESFNSFLTPEETVSVEVMSTLDAVTPFGSEASLLEKMRSESRDKLTSSNFSNPIYSQLSPPPPISSLTVGNLEPCGAETPYGPVGSQGEGKNVEQDRDEVRGEEVEILQLLSNGSNNSEPMVVISDYEKVEKQVECFRLQSLDSGVHSGEEVSQESLEEDSITVTDSHTEGEEEREGENRKEEHFQRLFRGSGGIFGKGSIQVCSDYERVQKLEPDSPELPSLDSGICSEVEEQVSQEESLEDVDKSTEFTNLLFPPTSPPSSPISYSLPSSPPSPLNFFGPHLSSSQRPLPSHILEKIALMSISMSVESSGDGYLPVRQEQS